MQFVTALYLKPTTTKLRKKKSNFDILFQIIFCFRREKNRKNMQFFSTLTEIFVNFVHLKIYMYDFKNVPQNKLFRLDNNYLRKFHKMPNYIFSMGYPFPSMFT